MNKPIHVFPRVMLSTLVSALLLQSAISYADDTEIFFGGPAIDESVRPNVLFVLDNSGSMQWRTSSNSNPSGSELSRMQILKNSFSSIINSAGAINAGIMVLNSRANYDGRMVYPVTNIDTPMPNSAEVVASTPEIIVSGDDATERTDTSNNAVINEDVLFMGNISNVTSVPYAPNKLLEDNDAFFIKPNAGQDYACRMDKPNSRPGGAVCTNNDVDTINLRAGSDVYVSPVRATSLLYFRDVRNSDATTIPANARLAADFTAYLDLRPTNTQGTRPSVQVSIERNKAPGALNDSSQVGGRTFLPTVTLQPNSWNSAQTATIDITQVIKDLLAIDGLPLDDVLIKVRATNNADYTFCARNCGSGNANAPKLRINYTSSSTYNETRMGALRFQNVGIPQGATVTGARLDFVPATTSSDPVTFTIKAESSNDASVFTNSSDLSGGRSKTAAMVSWAPDAWTNASPPVHIEGPTVTALVQEVVNRSSWCGNNSMAFYLEPTGGTGSRTAHSIDGAPGLQPTLTVTYTGGSGGCLNPIIEATVNSAKNDAYEENDDDMVLGGSTLPVDRSRFAARFEGMPIVRNATILDVKAILTPANTVAGANVSTTIRFESADNSAPFTSNDDDITDRNDTTDSTCVIDSWITGIPFSCSNSTLTAGLQGIVNRSGWAPGNAITFMSVQGADSNLEVQAYESNPAQAIKLRIKLANGGLASTDYTVRNHLNALVQSMVAGDGTPIVPTMNEGVRYLRGNRTGYDSPITSACQTTHMVILTDGQANGNGAQSSIGSLIGETCTGDASDSDEQCGRSLSEWAALTDQSSFDGDNFITTHTIGFALGALAPSTVAQDFLNDLAESGGGQAYTAENASQLSAAFSAILQDVLSTDTTFVSPGATVNQFNRQSNKNEVYFALFKPGETNRWLGNVKRYALNSGEGDIILDADGVGAIDGDTGFFKSDARSFWTATADGNNTAAGGVANQLPAAASRKVYTYLGASPVSPVTLTASQHLLNTANAGITYDKLGLTAGRSAERNSLINWLRGYDDVASSERKTLGDPLHSVPRLVTYRCNSYTDATYKTCASEDQSVFVGTNEGYVQAFDTNSGVEQMAFMPETLLSNSVKLRDNVRSTSLFPRPYGMDNTVVTWVNDINKNGVIYGGKNPESATPALLSGLNTGEFVYAYATMGRGGRNLYSLDVTDTNAPKLRWFLTPSTPGFARLGQTWSTPVVTKIKIGSTETPIIMFAGGYDETQDDVSIRDWNGDSKAFGSTRTQDQYGNALYIVNALTGQLIWSGSSEATNASAQSHQQLTKMKYSMPGSLRVIDINRDGYADQFFIGDMGGQVWRFFINNGNAVGSIVSPLDSGSGTTNDGVFASIIPADSGSESDAQLKSKLRRFYNEPDVALLTVNAGKSLIINIGSGFRGHPLDTNVEDRFYSFRTPIIDTNAVHSILSESDMYDATANLIQEGTASEKAAAATAFGSNTGGWYIRLDDRDGEKVLSRALTFAGQVFFSTYEPGNSEPTTTCKAVQGAGRSYAVNLFDATPVQQRVNGSPDRLDRVKALKTAGIPPDVVALFPEGKKKASLCNATECEDMDVDISVGPTYWIDEK